MYQLPRPTSKLWRSPRRSQGTRFESFDGLVLLFPEEVQPFDLTQDPHLSKTTRGLRREIFQPPKFCDQDEEESSLQLVTDRKRRQDSADLRSSRRNHSKPQGCINSIHQDNRHRDEQIYRDVSLHCSRGKVAIVRCVFKRKTMPKPQFPRECASHRLVWRLHYEGLDQENVGTTIRCWPGPVSGGCVPLSSI